MNRESEFITYFLWMALVIAAAYTLSQVGRLFASYLLAQMSF